MHDVSPEIISQITTRLLEQARGHSPHVQGAPNDPANFTPAAPEALVPTAGQPSLSAGSPGIHPSPSELTSRHPGIGSFPSPHAPISPQSFASVPSTPAPASPHHGASFVPPYSTPFHSSAAPSHSSPGFPKVHDASSLQSLGTSSYIPAAHGFTPSQATVGGDGLRAFVERVVRSDYRDEAALCPERRGLTPGASGNSWNPSGRAATGPRPLDVDAIRRDFPILRQTVHGKPLAWFDNAATTQKPQAVIDAVSHYYANDNSNIHRGAHTLAARSTDAFEQAREKIQKFLGAGSPKEIILVRGTTEGINLVAQTWGKKFLKPGDEIVLSMLEHHANIVPWQMIARETGAVIKVIPVNDRGEIRMEEYSQILGPRTKLVALAHANNSLGTILPVEEMTQFAKRYGATVLLDGAQTVSHIPVNVQQLGADFYVFSGHKIFGPTGIGAVYAREDLQELMPPWQGGGNMIKTVTFEETSYAGVPAKFEAGTPNIADTVGLGAALDYVQRIGLPNIAAYEHTLLEYATERLARIDGLRILGTAREKVSVLSFVLKDKRVEDVGRMLDLEGIGVRAGHHCAQPSLRRFGVEATVRPSLAFYNTKDEIDRLASVLRWIQRSTL